MAALPPTEHSARERWTLATGWIAWLASVLAPVLTFDIDLDIESDLGIRLMAYFQLFSAVVFLIIWRVLTRPPVWAIVLLLIVSAGTVMAFLLGREFWTCQYYDVGRFVIGSEMVDSARAYIAGRGLQNASCAEVISHFGNSTRIWAKVELTTRFLLLFGAFALAWWATALAVLSAVMRKERAA